MSRDIMTSPQPRYGFPVCAGEQERGGEEIGMCGRGYSGLGEAIFLWYGDDTTCGQDKDALSSGTGDDSFQKGWAKKPACKEDKHGCFHHPFEHAFFSPNSWWTGEPREEECGGGPRPCILDEIYIQEVRFCGEIVVCMKRMWKMGEERV